MKLLNLELTGATIGEPDEDGKLQDHDGYCLTLVLGPFVFQWMGGKLVRR